MTATGTVSVKRNYKDSLFRRIFGNKEKLLSLYNAVNRTHYGNPDDLRINTLDNAVYLNVKNDLSFVIDFSLNLYEHQSTYSANMPLRDLLYISSVYQAEVADQSLYKLKPIAIPNPVFVVFYNGSEEQPERWTERLSDAFVKKTDMPKLELEVLWLNVNYGKNIELMEQCKTLKEYSIYVQKVRKYAKIMSIEAAVERAVDESIREGILSEYLIRYRMEAIRMSILEYDEERELKILREEQYEIGRAEGKAEGKAEGQAEGQAQLISLIRKKLQKEMSAEAIADWLEMNPETTRQIAALIRQNPQSDDFEIARKLLDGGLL